MNLLLFPFHDYHKGLKEGFRTRDGHFLNQFRKNSQIDTLLVINRPMTLLEVLYKKSNWKTPGEVIYKWKGNRLVKLDDKTFVLDYLSNDILGQIRKKRSWYFKAYSEDIFVQFIKKSLEFLKIDEYNAMFSNLYSSVLLDQLMYKKAVFDAFDNWLQIPLFSSMQEQLKEAYSNYKRSNIQWVTNSKENKKYFADKFSQDNCILLPSGVNTERFCKEYPLPDDMSGVRRPIIGFAGKITSMFNPHLLNDLLEYHSDKSFVIIGQVLDKEHWNIIRKSENLSYLGDKHYDDYPGYVTNFDIGIIPYYFGDKGHGANTLKFYEYWASGINIVSTPGNGVEKVHEGVYLAEDASDFSKAITEALNNDHVSVPVPKSLSWEAKANEVLELFHENKGKGNCEFSEK